MCSTHCQWCVAGWSKWQQQSRHYHASVREAKGQPTQVRGIEGSQHRSHRASEVQPPKGLPAIQLIIVVCNERLAVWDDLRVD